MNGHIPIFNRLEIETKANCNRRCERCRRNYAEGTESWFTDSFLPSPYVYEMIDQLVSMNYKGDINLSHYNEPLLDSRIYKFAQYAKDRGVPIQLHTNGDFIDEVVGPKLAELFKRVHVSIYNERILKSRTEHIRRVCNGSHRIKVSYVDQAILPEYIDAEKLVALNKRKRCLRGSKSLIINHLGEMMLCCADMPGHFNLGNITRGTSLLDLWHSPKHERIIKTLRRRGGRLEYPYCRNCPRN